MTNRITMQDIVDLLVSRNGISKLDAEKFMGELFNVIEQGLAVDELVKIKDFGTFKLTAIQERESIDVNTQEKIIIPAHRRVSFIPAQTLKTLVNKPFAHFETTPLNDGIVLENVKQDSSSEDGDKEDENTIEEYNINDDKEKINESVAYATDDSDYLPVEREDSKKILLNEDEKVNEESLIDHSIESLIEIDPQIDETVEVHEEEHEEAGSFAVNPYINKSKASTLKPNCSFSPWYIITAVFLIFAMLFAYNLYYKEYTPTKQGVDENHIPRPVKEATAVIQDTLIEKTVIPVEAYETVNMEVGKTLRLIALDKYGDREFWVYIYLKNKDKIKNPDVVPVGLELVLPGKTEYDINAKNPESVAKAKQLGDKEMKKFW